jgi:septum formation protein
MSRLIILASSSPFRRELLLRLQLPFNVVAPDIDETPIVNEKPQATALRLAQLKARKVAETHKNALVIGCDQVATLDDLQIGKPGTHEIAFQQLQLLRGHKVTFHSAICLYNAESQQMQAEVVAYLVEFRQLTDAQIENYLLKEQPYNCAGSAKSEGLGIALIKSMEGSDPNALIGLPLIALTDMLIKEGISIV